MLMVEPSYSFAAWTARYAEFSGGPSVDALTAAAWAWPNGVLGSASSTAARAALAPRLVPSSARPGRASAVAPPSSTSRCRKVRLDRSPRSQASTSSVRPAWNSRRLRSLLIASLPDNQRRPAACDSPDALGRSQGNDIPPRLASSCPGSGDRRRWGTPGGASGKLLRRLADRSRGQRPGDARQGATAAHDPATLLPCPAGGGPER